MENYANIVYNYLSGEILESVALSLFTMKEQAIANVRFIYLSFQLRIMNVKKLLLQIRFYVFTFVVNVKLFSKKLES